MFVAQGVGQDERVEGVGLRRGHPIPLSGPGRDLRRHAEDLDPEEVQVLNQQSLGPLDRDPQPGPVAGQQPVEFVEPGGVVGHALLAQYLAVLVDQADLVERPAPVDAGEDLGRRCLGKGRVDGGRGDVGQRCSLQA
jgi:hypothetical protein